MTPNLIALCSLVTAIALRVNAGGEPPANTADGATGDPTPPPDIDESGDSSTGWLTPAGLLQQDDCGEDERGYYGVCVVHTRAEAVAAWKTWAPKSGSVLDEIAAERIRQVAKGYDAEHDDDLTAGTMGHAAALILLEIDEHRKTSITADDMAVYIRRKHHDDFRRQLIIAAALLVAEIERLDRGTARGGR